MTKTGGKNRLAVLSSIETKFDHHGINHTDGPNSTYEYFAVCAIAVPDQVTRDLLPATSLSELVGDPFGRRMRGDAKPEDLPPAMGP